MSKENTEITMKSKKEIREGWKKFALGLYLLFEAHYKSNNYFKSSPDKITPDDTHIPYHITVVILKKIINYLKSKSDILNIQLKKEFIDKAGNILFSFMNDKTNRTFIESAKKDTKNIKEHTSILSDINKALNNWDLEFLNYNGKKSNQAIVNDSAHPANTPISSFTTVKREIDTSTTTTTKTTTKTTTIPTPDATISATISATTSNSHSTTTIRDTVQPTAEQPVPLFANSVGQTLHGQLARTTATLPNATSNTSANPQRDQDDPYKNQTDDNSSSTNNPNPMRKYH